MGAVLSCGVGDGGGEASLSDYLAFVAGDEDYELTLYGVRKTKEAVERAIRANEQRLSALVGACEQKCAQLEHEVAEIRGNALRHRDAALSAPGGIKGMAAQAALTAGRLALTQLARQSSVLQREYTRLECGRAALDAIRSRAALQEDRRYFDSMRTSLNEARVPHEQLTYMQAAGAETLQQFAQLESQNAQYSTMMVALDKSLIDVGAKSTREHFGSYNLGDTGSLLAALDTLRTDSHQVSTTLEALDALPLPTGPPTHNRNASTTTLGGDLPTLRK